LILKRRIKIVSFDKISKVGDEILRECLQAVCSMLTDQHKKRRARRTWCAWGQRTSMDYRPRKNFDDVFRLICLWCAFMTERKVTTKRAGNGDSRIEAQLEEDGNGGW